MRILVIRPGALGDVLLTLPALQALRSAFPGGRIELMGNVEVLRWLPGRSVVGSVSSFDRADLAALFQAEGQAPESLREYLGQFDWIVSFATPREHVFVRNLTKGARGRVLSCDGRPKAGQQIHMSAYLQTPLRQLGLSPCDEPPHVVLTAADHRTAEQWWAEHGFTSKHVVAIHPGSGSPTKNWPAKHFAAVAQHFQRKRGAQVLLIRGPADTQSALEVQSSLGSSAYALLENPPIESLAAVLSHCELYLGNDSGVTHLAAAVGTPTVAVFGPTDPAIWAPRGAAVRVVSGYAPCAPCSDARRWECSDQVCLSGVKAEAVLAECLGLVEEVRRDV